MPPAVNIDRDLARRLEEIRAERGDSVKVDEITEVVRALLVSMTGDLSSQDLHLFQELESLANYIHAAKAEIAALRPEEIQSHYIATATDELDAIIAATEAATNEILDVAELIEAVQSEVSPEVAEKLGQLSTRIYEASNFQDITGQRINKIVKTLKHIEEKVEALVSAFGPQAAAAAKTLGTKPLREMRPDADLLNGPQMPDAATGQAEIDALLASFN